MRRPRLSAYVGDITFTLLAELLRAPAFFSWTYTRYQIPGTYCIPSQFTDFPILVTTIKTEIGRTATGFLDHSWFWFISWSNELFCHNCSNWSHSCFFFLRHYLTNLVRCLIALILMGVLSSPFFFSCFSQCIICFSSFWAYFKSFILPLELLRGWSSLTLKSLCIGSLIKKLWDWFLMRLSCPPCRHC